MARGAALRRNKSGKLVSAKSKTGNPLCSKAMSAIARGIAGPGEYQQAARCREMIRQRRIAEGARANNNEVRAQAAEARAAKNMTARERADRARALIAERRARQQQQRQQPATTAASVPARVEPAPTRRPTVAEQVRTRQASRGPETPRANALAARARKAADAAKRAAKRAERKGDLARAVERTQESIRQRERMTRLVERNTARSAPVDGRRVIDVTPAPPRLAPGRGTEDRLFAAQVLRAARRTGPEGRFGPSKAYVSEVHRSYQARGGSLGIDQFKRRLEQINNRRLINLNRADLVPAMPAAKVKASEIAVPGSSATFHFVRIETARGIAGRLRSRRYAAQAAARRAAQARQPR